MSIWKRLKEFGPWSRARLERDLEREIQNHLAYEAQESADRRALGNIPLVKEDVREAWGWARLDQFARDIHFGWRQVRRNPSFSAIAIGTFLVISLFVFIGGSKNPKRYRPGRPFHFTPVWFLSAPEQQSRAGLTAPVHSTGRELQAGSARPGRAARPAETGGASDRW